MTRKPDMEGIAAILLLLVVAWMEGRGRFVLAKMMR